MDFRANPIVNNNNYYYTKKITIDGLYIQGLETASR